jgi:hypothetical protein
MSGSLPRIWQKINEYCHSCHWWQNHYGCRITAMTFLLILLALAAIAIAATLRDVLADNGRTRPPSSHFEDPTFRAPAARI